MVRMRSRVRPPIVAPCNLITNTFLLCTLGGMNQCMRCRSPLSRFAKKFCSNSCQQKYQYDSYISSWLDNPSSVRVTVNVSRHLLKYLFSKYDSKCARCDWSRVHPLTGRIPLEVDHIDGNSANNSESNLVLLCPNCHSLTSTFRNLNKGSGRVMRTRNYGKM